MDERRWIKNKTGPFVIDDGKGERLMMMKMDGVIREENGTEDNR
jgi:hypothetical protein